MNAQLQARIRDAIDRQEERELNKCAFEIISGVTSLGHLPEDLFSLLLDVVTQDSFLHMSGSYELLRVFENIWEEMSTEQKSELFTLSVKIFPRFSDRMSCFVLADLLGTCYKNKKAVQALSHLSRTAPEIPRSCIPHALEQMAACSNDRLVAQKVASVLAAMQADESSAVRREVAESLRRLHAKR